MRLSWGEINDPDWTRLYAEKAREQVHDWVSAMGVEFVTLIPTPENRTTSKINTPRILGLQPTHYWMIFDQPGRETLSVRDTLWLNTKTISTVIIGNPDITASALILENLGARTGLAGINGKYGMAGTFLGPSILTGRLAGQGLLADLPFPLAPIDSNFRAPPPEAPEPIAGLKDLPGFIEAARPGYRHFEASHSLALERNYSCAMCHAPGNPKAPAQTNAAMLKRTETYLTCH